MFKFLDRRAESVVDEIVRAYGTQEVLVSVGGNYLCVQIKEKVKAALKVMRAIREAEKAREAREARKVGAGHDSHGEGSP